MKKLLTLLFTSIALYSCQDDILVKKTNKGSPATRTVSDSSEYYYWCDGNKISLTVNENKIFVLAETEKYKTVSKFDANVRAKIGHAKTMSDYTSLGVKSKNARQNITSFTLDNTNIKSINMDDLIYAAPYFKANDGADIGITNVFSVRLEGEQDLVKLEKIAKENTLEMIGRNEFDPCIYYLSCTKESTGNALEMANLMYESGAFKYATPEFIIKTRESAYIVPNDPRLVSQWNLRNLEYPGMDIDYFDLVTSFDFPNISNITVAVIDSGIHSGHEDLPQSTISYNAHTGTVPAGVYGDHGTLVAGIIGAIANNGKGIAGIASGVKIMSISLCSDENADRLGIAPSTISNFANGIRWAANNGANVINISREIETTSLIPEINDALTYAFGRDCVVVLGAGNNGVIRQPAAGAISPILVVGATDKSGHRLDEGVANKISAYGPALDVTAPGTNIWTTFSDGTTYSYTNAYSGTSLAAPHVSGIAALILSKFPQLYPEHVAEIIEKSAQKVYNGVPGGYIYSQAWAQHSTWNNEMGYGMVDAYRALDRAAAMAATPPEPLLTLDRQNEYRGGYIIFTVNNAPSGATIEWDVTQGITMFTSGNSIYVECPNGGFGGGYSNYLILRCRMTVNGSTSDWSDWYYVHLDYLMN